MSEFCRDSPRHQRIALLLIDARYSYHTVELGPVVSQPASAASGPASTIAEPVNSTPSKSRSAAIIFSITCITGISNLLAGLLTVCIPVIAADIGIQAGLQLWPASAFVLACGCTLLLCATAADLLGCRRVCLLGALLQAGSALGAGLSQTSTQLIALRAFAGVAASMCLPSAAGIVSSAFPHSTRPRTRTAAFFCYGRWPSRRVWTGSCPWRCF